MKKVIVLLTALAMALTLSVGIAAANTPKASIEYIPGQVTEIPLDDGLVLRVRGAALSPKAEAELKKVIETLNATDYDLIEAAVFDLESEQDVTVEYLETSGGIDVTFYRDDASRVIAVYCYADGQWQEVSNTVEETAIHCHFTKMCPVAFVFGSSDKPDDGGDSPATGYPDIGWIIGLCTLCVCGAVFCFVKAGKKSAK